MKVTLKTSVVQEQDKCYELKGKTILIMNISALQTLFDMCVHNVGIYLFQYGKIPAFI